MSNSLGEGVTNWDVYKNVAGKIEARTWSNGGLPAPFQGGSPGCLFVLLVAAQKEGPVLPNQPSDFPKEAGGINF